MYNIIQLIYGVLLFFVTTAHANTVSASSDCDDCEGTVYNLLADCPEFAQDDFYQAQENRGIGAFSGDGLAGCCGGSINMAISGGDILAVQRSGPQTGSCFTFKVQQAGQIPYSIEVPDDCDDCSVTVYHIVGDPPNYNGRSWTDSSIWAGIGESTSPSSPLSGEWDTVGKSGILDVAQGDNIGLCGHRNSGSSIHAFKITQIGCFIGSTEPITPPPRPALPLQPFVFPDNPTQRDVCRELTDTDACLANHECSWNVFQGMCNEFGHQPLFNGCDQCMFQPPPAFPDDEMYLGSCADPYNQDGWHMVFEVENGDGDDVPNDSNSAFNGLGTGGGFKTDNAYFWGANKLNAIEYTQVQVCGGYRATTDGCPRVKCYDVDSSMVPDGVDFPDIIDNAGFTNPMSKVIGCFSGGQCINFNFLSFDHGEWRFPIGYAADPAPMETYGEAETGEVVWSCLGFSGFVYGDGMGWHFQGNGWTAQWQHNGADELFLMAGCERSQHMPEPVRDTDYMNLFQIRVKE